MENNNKFRYGFTGLLLMMATFVFAIANHSGTSDFSSTIILLTLASSSVLLLTKALKESDRDQLGQF